MGIKALSYKPQREEQKTLQRGKTSSKRKTGLLLAIIAGLLALAAGFLIINSGFHTKSVMLSVLSNPIAKSTVQSFPEPLRLLASFTVLILSALVAFGGLLVVVGGCFVLARHMWLGKLLISLGGGFGFLGIAIVLGYTIMASGGFSVILSHVEYWTGLVLATVARGLAGRSQKR